MQLQIHDPLETVRSDADERMSEPVSAAWQAFAAQARAKAQQQLSPLTRAALELGLSFDDVYEYARSRTASARPLDLPERIVRDLGDV